MLEDTKNLSLRTTEFIHLCGGFTQAEMDDAVSKAGKNVTHSKARAAAADTSEDEQPERSESPVSSLEKYAAAFAAKPPTCTKGCSPARDHYGVPKNWPTFVNWILGRQEDKTMPKRDRVDGKYEFFMHMMNSPLMTAILCYPDRFLLDVLAPKALSDADRPSNAVAGKILVMYNHYS
jgi:hypothetical protein